MRMGVPSSRTTLVAVGADGVDGVDGVESFFSVVDLAALVDADAGLAAFAGCTGGTLSGDRI